MDGETGDDAPTRRELQEQVDELQETVRKMMPGRRRVLKGVGAGALFGVGAVSGANAAPGDDGDTVWGSDSNRDDYYADEIDAISVSTDDTNTKRIGEGDYHFAADYSGGDPDERLDAAISAASASETIYLETGAYDSSRTISKTLSLIGPSIAAGADIQAKWTLNSPSIHLLRFNLAYQTEIQIDGINSSIESFKCSSGTIDVNASRVHILHGINGGTATSVNFDSGSSNGLVDSCSNFTVTDNGTNTIGDLA